MKPMYSAEWFETFAATVPAALVEADLAGVIAALPLNTHARVLDIGCGIGRLAGPLAARGYAVTGVDISVDALLMARQHSADPRYVALDQRHIGAMRWQFDAALFMWNSLGYVDRSTDLETLNGVARTLRPGGKVVFDLYHPGWLEQNQRAGEPDDRGAVVRRWMHNGRCMHEIRYPNGQVDDIQFDVFEPEEIRDLCRRTGLEAEVEMVRWSTATRPSAEFPRYQMICSRR